MDTFILNEDCRFNDLMSTILFHGERETVGENTCVALYNHTVEMDMNKMIIEINNRPLFLKYALTEAAWMMMGGDDIEFVSELKTLHHFANGRKFDGAYGPQLKLQLDTVVEHFEKDLYTRRASACIMRPNLSTSSKDTPCTLVVTWYIRYNKLNCSVVMRSSDAYMGLPIDLTTFTLYSYYLRARLREELNIVLDMGCITNFAVNRHVYVKAGPNNKVPILPVDNSLEHGPYGLCSPEVNFTLGNIKDTFKDIPNASGVLHRMLESIYKYDYNRFLIAHGKPTHMLAQEREDD